MEHSSTVDIGERKRSSGGINEDSVATAIFENHHRQTSRPVGVFVLGDGVGGEACGDIASTLATTVVRKQLADALLGSGTDVFERFELDAFRDRPPTIDEATAAGSILTEGRIRMAIQSAIDEANRHIQAFAREIDGRPATTLVVAVYHDGRLHYAWVGDSRLYLINETHGAIHQLTRDHAVTNDLLDRGEIEDEEFARVHQDATAITNAIGGSAHGQPHVDVEFGVVEVYRDDIIMLTSDGLIDAYPDIAALREEYRHAEDTEAVREKIRETLVTDDEIRDLVIETATLDEAVEGLVSLANDRGGKDNLSITLARDLTADESPAILKRRGHAIDTTTLAGKSTEIEAPDADDPVETAPAEDEDDEPNDLPVDTDAEEGEPEETTDTPPAALAVMDGVAIELDGAVSIGHPADGIAPDVEIPVGEDSIVEPHHAQIEFDDDRWHLRDTSSSGTFLEVDEGEWMLLLSSEGAAFQREQGFDPGATVGREINESFVLEEGMAFTLEDPRDDETTQLRFFSSLDEAEEVGDEEITFKHFRV